MANSADPDQLASSEANRSGSTLNAKAGYIQVQQDMGYSEANWSGSTLFAKAGYIRVQQDMG